MRLDEIGSRPLTLEECNNNQKTYNNCDLTVIFGTSAGKEIYLTHKRDSSSMPSFSFADIVPQYKLRPPYIKNIKLDDDETSFTVGEESYEINAPASEIRKIFQKVGITVSALPKKPPQETPQQEAKPSFFSKLLRI